MVKLFLTKDIRLGNAKGLIHEYEERTTLDCGNFKNQGIVKLKKREKINTGRFNHPCKKKECKYVILTLTKDITTPSNKIFSSLT